MLPLRLCRLLVAATVLVCMVPLWAQPDLLRRVSGTVTDPQHEPLRGAVVELQNTGSNAVASFITDETGHYLFQRLDSNTDFSVWVTFRGRKSRIHSISKFDSHMDKVVNFVVPTF